MWPTLLVFAATYLVIAFPRTRWLPLGRATAAFVGAAAMVGLFAIDARLGLSPTAALRAVEPGTLGLLLGMMLLSAALAEAGAFERAAAAVARRALSPAGLLYAVTIGSGLLSALLLNDTVCLLLAAPLSQLALRARLPRGPYLLALAMGANAGSAITLAGNPQNVLVAQLSQLGYRDYLLRGGPAALLALCATALVLHILFVRQLVALPSEAEGEPPIARASHDVRRLDLIVAVGGLGLVSLAFLAGADLAWSALCGAALVMLLRRRDGGPLLGQVAWPVLVLFGGLFILTEALGRTGLPERLLEASLPYLPRSVGGGVLWLSGALIAGCQIVSNVPFILLVAPWVQHLPDPDLAWTVTAVVSTLAGNLTLLGSMANLIVVESAQAEGEIGFRTYLLAGIPVTLASTGVALGWLLLSAPLYR